MQKSATITFETQLRLHQPQLLYFCTNINPKDSKKKLLELIKNSVKLQDTESVMTYQKEKFK